MVKTDVIFEVRKAVNLPSTVIDAVITKTLEVITAELACGGKVQLKGFGTFETRDRAPHRNINPRTQAEMIIPAKKTPAFKPYRALKAAVDK